MRQTDRHVAASMHLAAAGVLCELVTLPLPSPSLWHAGDAPPAAAAAAGAAADDKAASAEATAAPSAPRELERLSGGPHRLLATSVSGGQVHLEICFRAYEPCTASNVV